MKLYVQLTIIFTISLIGEIISDGLHLPIPGSMIGLLILFLLLQFKLLRMRHVNMVGNFLLANMTILFLPPAVGIMDKFHVIAPYLFPIMLILLGALVINVVGDASMANFASNPLFGIVLSIWAYLIGMLIFRRYPHPITTPLLVATVIVILFLMITGISYKDYYVGGSLLNQLIGPSTVALGIPLYKSFHLMKHHARSILIGSTVAVIVNTIFTALIAKAFGMKYFLAISLFPKSVTTAMAVGITEKMQGITTITLVVVVATGLLTSVLGPTILKLLKIKDPVAIGLALGGTGHAVGTGTAFKYGHVAGAMAGLAIGITGILYVFISPIVASMILS